MSTKAKKEKNVLPEKITDDMVMMRVTMYLPVNVLRAVKKEAARLSKVQGSKVGYQTLIQQDLRDKYLNPDNPVRDLAQLVDELKELLKESKKKKA